MVPREEEAPHPPADPRDEWAPAGSPGWGRLGTGWFLRKRRVAAVTSPGGESAPVASLGWGRTGARWFPGKRRVGAVESPGWRRVGTRRFPRMGEGRCPLVPREEEAQPPPASPPSWGGSHPLSTPKEAAPCA